MNDGGPNGLFRYLVWLWTKPHSLMSAENACLLWKLRSVYLYRPSKIRPFYEVALKGSSLNN